VKQTDGRTHIGASRRVARIALFSLLAALVPATLALAAQPRAGSLYRGTTSEGRAIGLRVSGDRQTVKWRLAYGPAACRQPRTHVKADEALSVAPYPAIGSDGSFRDSGYVSDAATFNGHPARRHARIRFYGRFYTRHRARGRFYEEDRFYSRSGRAVASCVRRLTWTALIRP
jgi:hypothetical protein